MRLIIFLMLLVSYNLTVGQTKTEIQDVIANSVHSIANINELKLTEISRLIPGIDSVKVLGLGEGTHGTKEFINFRADVSKILIKEKGYKIIFIESSFGDTYEFNRQLNNNVQNLDSLMKERLFAIYQTEEYKSFFQWLQKHNAGLNEGEKVKIVGIDFALVSSTSRLLKDDLSFNKVFSNLCDTIVKQASFQDSIWINMNRKEFKFDMKAVVINGIYMVANVHSVKKLAADNNIKLSSLANLCIMNIEHAGEPFYAPQKKRPARSRDELMAQVVEEELKENNLHSLIWAHNGHVAYKAVKGSAGGMGKFIKKQHPSYFSLATGTALGNYNATLDRFNNNQNKFKPYPLNKPIKGSWEEVFMGLENNYNYLDLTGIKNKNFLENLRFRVIGYGLQSSGDGDYVDSALGDLFDGLVFIKSTASADSLK